MERFDKSKQAEICKMSDARLVVSSLRVRLTEDKLDGMERAVMMERWLELFVLVGPNYKSGEGG